MPTGPKGQKRPGRRDCATIVHDMEWVVGMIDAYDRKLRATATAERLKPIFSFSFTPHERSALSERHRVIIVTAAS
jgi:hypothetical protein